MGAAALALIGCGSDDGGDSGGPLATATAGTGATGTPKPGGTYASYFATIANYNVTAGFHAS